MLASPSAGAEDRRYGGDLARLRFADEWSPIEASLYSLPSAFFDSEEARALLAAVRAQAPSRRLLAICDPRMCDGLGGAARALDVELLPSGLGFSPWPRDPLSFARDPAGELVVVGRPDAQPGRAADSRLAEFLAAALPGVDPAWRLARFAVSPLPFHGGQLLAAPGVLWLSLHSVEPRATRLLGLERVPVEDFAEPRGVARYAAAAEAAARELARLFGRRPEFVHPLPSGDADPAAPDLARDLAGGAGFDLDSCLTLLPGEPRTIALIGDLRLGDRLLSGAPLGELAALAAAYRLSSRGEPLRQALRAAQSEPRGAALGVYLDRVAAHLPSLGLRVERLPLLRVPTALLDDRAGVTHPDFLLTWNNVVLERGPNGLTAEGFASGLPSGDRVAERIFGAAGARLRLLPPLVHSMVLNGGYRCASNHLRRGR